MSEAFAWIGDLMQAIGRIIPRLLHVPNTHGGVLFTRGRHSVLTPGLHVYWPVWSQPIVYPVKRTTLDLDSQSLVTHDRQSIAVSATVVYYINDIERALTEVYSLTETVSDIAQSSVKEVITKMSFGEFMKSQEAADEMLTNAMRAKLQRYGIRCSEAFFSDFAPHLCIRLLADRRSQIEGEDE